MESPHHITVGVLGHVDHGKTSLVRALTGMDTDRLKEEKKRGLSIVLGYAYLESKDGVIDFIDVPGHEDFIRMMISGATGIDYVLLTIAANEGIQPQTKEHFNIVRYLGIKNGLVVITKSDLVSESTCNDLKTEINDFTRGTFMEGAQIIKSSTNSEQSLSHLRSIINGFLLDPVERKLTGKCYLPLDRVFSMSGFGTVATGTLRNGDLKKGQEVEIMPTGLPARIRQIQVHNQPVDVAHSGQRVAVNLRNVDREEIKRGDALVATESLQITRLLDAEIEFLDDLERIPKYAEIVRVLFGTCEILAMIRVLGTNKHPEPGTTCIVQFSCLRDVVVPIGERIIIRSMSPVMTIAGGRILDNSPVKHRRSDKAVVTRLQNLASDNKADVVSELINATTYSGIEIEDLITSIDISKAELEELVDESKIIRLKSQRLMSKQAFEQLCTDTLDEIKNYHKENPSRPGQPISELRSRLPNIIDDFVFKFLIEHLNGQGELLTDDSTVRQPDFNPLQTLSPQEQKMNEEILSAFESGGLKPPELDDVLRNNAERKRLYHLLKEAGKLIPILNNDINRTIVFHESAIAGMIDKMEKTFAGGKTFTVADVRKLVDTSRKFAIPLLEYLDKIRVTIRVGDKRKLFKK